MTKGNLKNPHFSSIDELNVDETFRLLKINIFDAKQIATPASAMLLINLARLTTAKFIFSLLLKLHMKVHYFISQFEHHAQSKKLDTLIQQTFVSTRPKIHQFRQIFLASKFLVVWYEYFYAIYCTDCTCISEG